MREPSTVMPSPKKRAPILRRCRISPLSRSTRRRDEAPLRPVPSNSSPRSKVRPWVKAAGSCGYSATISKSRKGTASSARPPVPATRHRRQTRKRWNGNTRMGLAPERGPLLGNGNLGCPGSACGVHGADQGVRHGVGLGTHHHRGSRVFRTVCGNTGAQVAEVDALAVEVDDVVVVDLNEDVLRGVRRRRRRVVVRVLATYVDGLFLQEAGGN